MTEQQEKKKNMVAFSRERQQSVSHTGESRNDRYDPKRESRPYEGTRGPDRRRKSQSRPAAVSTRKPSNRKRNALEDRRRPESGRRGQHRKKRPFFGRRRRKNGCLLAAIVSLVLLIGAAGIGYVQLTQYLHAPQPLYASAYEAQHYNQKIYQDTWFAQDLCVAASEKPLEGFVGDTRLHAAGLFDVEQKQTLYADRIHDRLYPASTTKLLTAYVTLKHGNLEDLVTVSETAVAFLDPEAQLCGLNAGEQLSLYDLLCGLILYSGNDNANVIAEHLSGSVESFVELMNQEAYALGATQTHFTNPHGLQDENHYTTAYDLYLICNACIKDPRFLEILAMKSYTASLTTPEGSVRTVEWIPTNFYSAGLAAQPTGVQVIGGKTGTTDEAGSCLVLYNLGSTGKPYISVVMGAPDKEILYQNMTQLLEIGAGA